MSAPMARTLEVGDLELDRGRYLREVRPGLRARLIPLRAARRVRLGDAVLLEFEDADTLLYQVQEMLAVEAAGSGAIDPAAAEADVLLYSRLLPTMYSLVATLLIEGDDVGTVRDDLERLTGLQHAVALRLRPEGGPEVVVPGEEVPGPDEDGPSEVTHAVHFLRFSFSLEGRALFLDPGVPAELVVDHPEYAASAPLAGALRDLLAGDLAAPA